MLQGRSDQDTKIRQNTLIPGRSAELFLLEGAGVTKTA